MACWDWRGKTQVLHDVLIEFNILIEFTLFLLKKKTEKKKRKKEKEKRKIDLLNGWVNQVHIKKNKSF